MYAIADLSRLDWDEINRLPVNPVVWCFFDVAPYDDVCANLDCGGIAKIPWLHAWCDYVIFACSPGCAANAVRRYRARLERREFQNNVAVSVVPVGVDGSYKLIRPSQGPLL